MIRSFRTFCVTGLAALAVLAGSAMAQSFPSQPIRLIVPAAPGGGLEVRVTFPPG